MALLVRLAAWFVLSQPLESDGLAYFTMAKSLAVQGTLLDNMGQHAFYSAGYPLLLAPAFAVFGATVPVAIGINLLLAALSILLILRIALLLTSRMDVAALAATLHAFWLPAIWNATMLAKENLSTPLLLALVLNALLACKGVRPRRSLALAGLCWGAGLVTGGSSLLTCAAAGLALLVVWHKSGVKPAIGSALAFAAGAALMLAPWLYATDRMIGAPVLTTNAAFNLYLGNNPAADGSFVSIANTPVGPRWQQIRADLGEAGTAGFLQHEAKGWIKQHPATAASLAIRKLVLFWTPNVPDAKDFAASRAISIIRLADVIEFCCITLLGAAALLPGALAPIDRLLLGGTIAGFWLVHAAAYVLPRYRDPVMPLVIILAATILAPILSRIFLPQEKSFAG